MPRPKLFPGVNEWSGGKARETLPISKAALSAPADKPHAVRTETV